MNTSCTTTAARKLYEYSGIQITPSIHLTNSLHFRTSDAKMIANYRVQAELTAVESTPDGKALVLGTVDGCVSVLAIVDTNNSDMSDYLSQMPSRDENVSRFITKII